MRGKTVGIDATTLEANAALRSIVRRDSGERYEAFLHGLAAASGIPTPTRAELARLDRKRPKKGSNADWTHPQDPDAKITKMKDGRTHLAHKAEQAVDLETGAVVGVTVQDAAAGDTTTMVETLLTATEQLDAVLPAGADLAEVVGDKGYHSNQTLVTLADFGLRSYVSEPARGRRLLRRRGEHLERPHAHLYETGRLRRAHLRGHANIIKRLLVHVCGLNLGLLMRRLTGIGTPRSLQGRARTLVDALTRTRGRCWRLLQRCWARGTSHSPDPPSVNPSMRWHQTVSLARENTTSATGC